MENNWHEKLFDFSSNPSYITITCVGIEPRTTGCKSDTLTRDYLPALKSMVNIILKYVTLNTTHAFNRSPIFVSGSLSVSIIGYGVPLLSYYMRVLLIDLHKYGKPLEKIPLGPFRTFSDIWSMIRHSRFIQRWLHISWTRVIQDNVSLAWTNLSKARLNCVDGTALASSGSWR